jgi:hypothetical protein
MTKHMSALLSNPSSFLIRSPGTLQHAVNSRLTTLVRRAVLHLNAQEIAQADLCDVVCNVLIVQQTHLAQIHLARRHGFLPHLSIRHHHPLQALMHNARVLPPHRLHPAPSQRREVSIAQCLSPCIRVRVFQLKHRFAELCLAEEKQPDVGAHGGEAVVCGLGGYVCEVDALAEHVARDWSFGGSDTQALGEDAAVVRAAGAVPEEAAVGEVGGKVGVFGVGEAGFFFGTGDAEDILDLCGVSMVHGDGMTGRDRL